MNERQLKALEALEELMREHKIWSIENVECILFDDENNDINVFQDITLRSLTDMINSE